MCHMRSYRPVCGAGSVQHKAAMLCLRLTELDVLRRCCARLDFPQDFKPYVVRDALFDDVLRLVFEFLRAEE